MDLFNDPEILAAQDGVDGSVDVTFDRNIAVMTMNCGQNRFNYSFINKLNKALDEVER